jgi:hypothetical protein
MSAFRATLDTTRRPCAFLRARHPTRLPRPHAARVAPPCAARSPPARAPAATPGSNSRAGSTRAGRAAAAARLATPLSPGEQPRETSAAARAAVVVGPRAHRGLPPARTPRPTGSNAGSGCDRRVTPRPAGQDNADSGVRPGEVRGDGGFVHEDGVGGSRPSASPTA